jgi:hypothetical protein
MGRLVETFTFGRNALKRSADESAQAALKALDLARSGPNLTNLKGSDNGTYNIVRDLISLTGILRRDDDTASVTTLGTVFSSLASQSEVDAWRWLLARSLWLYCVPNGTDSHVNKAAAELGVHFEFFRTFLGLTKLLSALPEDGRFISYLEICELLSDDSNWQISPVDLFKKLLVVREGKPDIVLSTRTFLGDLEDQYGIPRDNFSTIFNKAFAQTGLFQYRSDGRKNVAIALSTDLDFVQQRRVRFILDNSAPFSGDWPVHLSLKDDDFPQEVSLKFEDSPIATEVEVDFSLFVSDAQKSLQIAGL